MAKIMGGKLFEYDTNCETPSCMKRAKERIKKEGYPYVRTIKKSFDNYSYWEIWKSKDVPRSKKAKKGQKS